MTLTAVATDAEPTSWDEAADAALSQILNTMSFPVFTREQVVPALRGDLDDMIRKSFHNDTVPATLYLGSMALAARDHLMWNNQLPCIEQLARILADKQANYGSRNILTFGVKGIIIRVSDKVARIENMVANDRSDETEPLADAFIDIIGYATIAVMLDKGWFELPLLRDQEFDIVPADWADTIETTHRHPTSEATDYWTYYNERMGWT